MAGTDQGAGRGHLRPGHAAAGHPERKGPDGRLHRGPGAANPVLRGPERTGEHPKAAGAGHRGGEGAGGAVRQAAQAAAGGVPPGVPAVEIREDHRHGGGKGVRDAAVHVPVSGGDLRKCQVVVGGGILQEGVLYCKRKPLFIFLSLPQETPVCNTFFKKIPAIMGLQ